MLHKVKTRTDGPSIPNATLCSFIKSRVSLDPGVYTKVVEATSSRALVRLSMQAVDYAVVNYAIGDSTQQQFPPMTASIQVPTAEVVVRDFWVSKGDVIYMRATTDVIVDISRRDEQ